MNALALASALKWLASIVALATQLGQTWEQLQPILVMIKQVIVDGKDLTTEQRADAQARHIELTDAAVAALGARPDGAL